MGSRGTVTIPSGEMGIAEVGVWVLVDVAGGEVGSVEDVGVRMGGCTSVAQANPVSPKNKNMITEYDWHM